MRGAENTAIEKGPPADRPSTSVFHRVAFYETDAMGVVHHSNFIRFFELARVDYLASHDRPYTHYIEQGLHFAVTSVKADFMLSAKFDDVLEVETWMTAVRGASLSMAYRIFCDAAVIAIGETEHACLNKDGRVLRIPREDLKRLRKLCQDSE